jgi:glutamate:GABA antiporter
MKTKRQITVFLLVMLNIATILSIRNLPLTAKYGFSSVFFLAVPVIVFFIPCALVSAELASAWPERGGIFVWVKEAMGHKLGFLSVWLLWIENVFYYPTLLSFIAAAIAYIIDPALLDSKLYNFTMIVTLFWFATLINLRGMRFSSILSSVSAILGTIIPGVLIIVLGFVWYVKGSPTEIDFSWQGFIPDVSSPSKLSFIAGVLLGYAGIELSAVHAREVKNPQKAYPRATLLSALCIIILSILGTLSIAIVIPSGKISLVSGSLEAIDFFFKSYGFSQALPIMAFLMGLGAIGTLSTWIIGPTKGFLGAAEAGDLPPIFHKVNNSGMPIFMMLIQAIFVTLLSAVFLYLPNVSSSYWILLAMASQFYLLMYILMFIAGIVLRYKHPRKKRHYKVGGGNFGMILICSIGIIASTLAFLLGFVPPAELDVGNTLFFESFMIIGIIIGLIIPFIILAFKKESWKKSS